MQAADQANNLDETKEGRRILTGTPCYIDTRFSARVAVPRQEQLLAADAWRDFAVNCINADPDARREGLFGVTEAAWVAPDALANLIRRPQHAQLHRPQLDQSHQQAPARHRKQRIPGHGASGETMARRLISKPTHHYILGVMS